MGINPGNPAFGLPPADDDLARLIKDLERTTRENLASVVDSFKTTVERLNDAIASVIVPHFNQDGINNYAISTTSTIRKTVTFTVPDGYTQAMVLATASAMGLNDSGLGDYLIVQANVAGVDGGELYSYAGPDLATGLSAMLYWSLSALAPGQTFDVSVKTRTNNNPWSASTSNQANIYALVIYSR